MPAPSAELIAAIRSGDAARHLLLFLDHPDGDVYAWDGIGNLSYGGHTYYGVYGLSEISGVGESTDIQNHDVTITLNAVPLEAIRDSNPNVRNKTATIRAIWMREDRTLLSDTLVLFSGKADYIVSSITEDTAKLQLTLRSPFADFSQAPNRFYTHRDQQRLYPSDTGLQYMQDMENNTITEWKTTAGTSMDWVKWDSSNEVFKGVDSNALVIDASEGALLRLNDFNLPISAYGATYDEEQTASLATVQSGLLRVGGFRCYIDTDANRTVRTSGGNKINAGTGRYMRGISVVAVGSAGVDKPGPANEDPNNSGNYFITKNNGTVREEADHKIMIIDNEDGDCVRGIGTGTPLRNLMRSANYVEASTGSAVTYASATGALQVGGVDCTISTTGVVRTPAGNRVIRSGATASRFYLRLAV